MKRPQRSDDTNKYRDMNLLDNHIFLANTIPITKMIVARTSSRYDR